MDMISPLVDAYALQYTSPEEALMQEINEFTMRNHPQSNMLSGHVQGKLLSFISTILRPKYVLEVGTFVGYSGLYLAQGLPPDGELHTLELREEDAQTARGYFARSEKDKQIHLHTGNALNLIPQIDRQEMGPGIHRCR